MRLKPVLKLFAQGAAVRWCGMAAVAAISFFAPLLLGAREYGLAVSLLALPYLIQGLAEPVIMTVTIRWHDTNPGRIRRLRRDTAWLTALNICAAVLYGQVLLEDASLVERVGCSLLLAGFAGLTMVTTHLLAAAYGRHRAGVISRVLFASALFLPILLFSFRELGALGMLAALCLNQGFIIVLLLAARDRCTEAATSEASGHNRWSEYSHAVLPRISLIVLTSLTVLLASTSMSASDLASFKLTLSLIVAGSYFVPVSPELIQAAFRGGAQDRFHGHGPAFLGGIFLLTCALAGVLYLFAEPIHTALLGRTGYSPLLGIMFLGMPFYCVISPFSAYLLALGREQAFRSALVATLAGLGLGWSFQGLPLGFTLGSVAFVLFAWRPPEFSLCRNSASRAAVRAAAKHDYVGQDA